VALFHSIFIRSGIPDTVEESMEFLPEK